jgi:hypothetical protein
MAEKRRSGRGKGVPNHPLVEALASDPSKPPERATKLFGFPGPAADADTTRLWLDAELTTYVDVPNDAIIHSQTLENDKGTILWVDPAAKLTYSSTQSHEVQAEFLGGSIAERNLGAASPPGVGPQRVDRTFSPQLCPPFATQDLRLCWTWAPGCTPQTPVVPCDPPYSLAWAPCPPSDFAPCEPSFAIPCQTKPWTGCEPWTVVQSSLRCPSRVCPSRAVPCPTPVCPSTAGGCPSDACGVSVACNPGGPGDLSKPIE